MGVPRGPTQFLCSSCIFTCKSKPTLSNHRRKLHGSIGKVLSKPEPKKRQAQHFTCLECQSTFTTRPKLKKHVKDQHAEEDDHIIQESSPPRKAAKEDLDQRIIEEEGNESKELNTTNGMTVNIEKMDQDKPDHEGTILNKKKK